MCYRKQRVHGPYFTHLTFPKFFFINEMSYLITVLIVRFGIVIALCVVKYKKIGFILVKITKNVDMLGTWWTR